MAAPIVGMSEVARPSPRRNLLASPVLWAGLLSLVAAYPIATLILGDPFSTPPPRLTLLPAGEHPSEAPGFVIPRFELTDESGKTYGSKNLLGHVWVASFFFTSCPTICPKLTERLVQLQAALEKAQSPVKMVTFTVDPAHDTPEVLRAHARKVGADARRWRFLTGEPGKLEQTIVEGFKQPMGTPDDGNPEAAAMAIAHGVRFVLVDRDLGVRGLYDADDQGLSALVRDAAAL